MCLELIPMMIKKLTTLFSCILLLTSVSSHAETNTDQWIIEQMKTYNIPGCSIAVIKNYKIKWAKAYGLRDKAHNKPVTTDTLFQAASIGKPITALATVTAFHEKHLSLNTNINDILTSWKIPASNYTKHQPVTMRLLLAHTSGVIGFRYKGYTTHDKLPTLLQELNGIPPANTQPVTVIRKPGSKYEYCPAGYTIIQQVLEDIYKKTFADIMQTLILDPLQMQHSTFDEPLPQKWLQNVALPYLPNGKLMPDSPIIFIASTAGGLWSTPSDIAKFVIAVQKTLAGKTPLQIDANIMQMILTPAIDHNMGLGFEVNINKYGEQSKTRDNYFRHGGFNSGYLSMFVGSKTKGNGF
jgi:CubicO group peptidase (beta-lactamase class C family)